MKLAISIALWLMMVNAFAQRTTDTSVPVDEEEDPEDSIVYKTKLKKPDSLKEKFFFRSVRIGTDLLSIAKTIGSKDQYSNRFSGWEINGDADFGKVYLVVDVGHWAREYDINYDKGGHYSNNGNYFRVGADLNLLKKDPEKNMFFFGFRLGQSFYNESAVIIFPADVLFLIPPKTLHNNGVSASWGEFVIGMRIKVWKEFWMGYTARMKFAPGAAGDTSFKSFDIPGYGLNDGSFYWGFNYQVFWRFGGKKAGVKAIGKKQ